MVPTLAVAPPRDKGGGGSPGAGVPACDGDGGRKDGVKGITMKRDQDPQRVAMEPPPWGNCAGLAGVEKTLLYPTACAIVDALSSKLICAYLDYYDKVSTFSSSSS